VLDKFKMCVVSSVGEKSIFMNDSFIQHTFGTRTLELDLWRMNCKMELNIYA